MARVHIRIGNSEDNFHCLQASFRMVLEALGRGDPGPELADQMTGFRPGHGTWQFRMLLSFANAGLTVTDHERLYVNEFLRDPAVAIRLQVRDPAVAAQYIADTDCDAERAALQECLRHPNIVFRDSVPALSDMVEELHAGRYVMCYVNSRVLAGKPGNMGHMIVVEDIGAERVRIQDPGPPTHFDRDVPLPLFTQAWMSASPDVANMFVVSK
jgi:hypothetical protein